MSQAMDRVFQALACETRLRILELLAGRALCGKALAQRLGVTTGAVSQHLRVLKDAGLVSRDRRGNHVHYTLREEGIEQCRQALGGLLDKTSKRNSCSQGQGESSCLAKNPSARSRAT